MSQRSTWGARTAKLLAWLFGALLVCATLVLAGIAWFFSTLDDRAESHKNDAIRMQHTSAREVGKSLLERSRDGSLSAAEANQAVDETGGQLADLRTRPDGAALITRFDSTIPGVLGGSVGVTTCFRIDVSGIADDPVGHVSRLDECPRE
ncbi:hypothetical protein FHX42_004788 [Saccharopolyspora lacisalsi]|uniref:Uncharacterized protein n=1 Tax=Halosaccharopolyspora lacisalsi TaxID=1000566 RepID=A0A839DZM5_9PSEU|nr:hypothetical protein [Halosaccharopolyspora lacisalsi]MBA8827392.1 hypothetical protein [Halosaccharopolyspora lacisalsi]